MRAATAFVISILSIMVAVLPCVAFFSGCCGCSTRVIHPGRIDERKDIKVLYPLSPLVVDYDGLKSRLSAFEGQISFLYILPDDCICGSYDEAAFLNLRELQSRFYRYGLQVILVDLHSPNYWGQLRKLLMKCSANFLAMYIKDVDKDKLFDLLGEDIERPCGFVLNTEGRVITRIESLSPLYKVSDAIRDIISKEVSE